MSIIDLIWYVRDDVRIILNDGKSRVLYEGKAHQTPIKLAMYPVCDLYAEENMLTIVTGGIND